MSNSNILLPIYQRIASILSSLWPVASKSPFLAKQLLDGSVNKIEPSILQQFKNEIDQNLEEHVLQNWFPQSVDQEFGGFHQDYNASWRLAPNKGRGVVYQSRNTWLAAHVAIHKPSMPSEEKARLVQYSNHGVDFLLDTLWDSEHGGFFWKLDQDGEPADDGEKHLYGISFAIYALAENFRLTGSSRPLDFAKKAFRWLEKHAHDKENQGYYEAYRRDGTPITSRSLQRSFDAIGTLYGFKSMNSHIHLLESFTNLYDVCAEEPLLRERLVELFHVVGSKIVIPEIGAMNLFFLPDWRPVPDHDSFGHDVEAAFLLVEAAELLQVPSDEMDETWDVARRLVDHALEFGWDNQLGGFYDAGSTFQKTFDPRKVWWIQAEALNALAVMHEHFGRDSNKYWNALVEEWEWIKRHQIDKRNTGWIAEVERDGKREKGQRKSDEWTDGYHQSRALINVGRILAKLIAME